MSCAFEQLLENSKNHVKSCYSHHYYLLKEVISVGWFLFYCILFYSLLPVRLDFRKLQEPLHLNSLFTTHMSDLSHYLAHCIHAMSSSR